MTGEDGTADRNGHGMGDDRSGDTPSLPGDEQHTASVPGPSRPGTDSAEDEPRLPYGGTAPAPERRHDETNQDAAREPRPPSGGATPAPTPPYGAATPVPTSPYGEQPAVPKPSYGDTPPVPKRTSHDPTAPEPRLPVGDAVPVQVPVPVPPDAATAAPHGTPLEALLSAALRGDGGGVDGERRAVRAFRVARDGGAHRARTRRRDDWRPRAQRRRARSLKATFSALLASLTLGGVAYATIGSGGGGGGPVGGAAGEGSVRPHVGSSAPAESDGGSRSPASTPADRPVTAKDTLAHCRVYEKLQGRGKALDSTAFRRLVAAAGGEENVSAYCAALTGTAADAAGGADDEAKPGKQKGKPSAEPNADKNTSKKQ